MTPLDIACVTALSVITATQVVLVGMFDRICRSGTARGGATPPGERPCLTPARVVLCLRGSDPFLTDTIRAAATQDHPDYELRVIVDCEADPAWDEVHRVIADPNIGCRVSVEPLDERPTTSSLKCASLLQGLRGSEDTTAMVALLDADVVPPPDWLRTLGEALAHDGCGVATGNRWYRPPDHSPAAWTRAGWNAGALVQMVCFGIPWGGTLALRSDLVESAGLRRKWAAAFCEDTLLPAALRGHGQRVTFVPALIAVNRESVTMQSLVPWITRQLLTARLYHPAWPVVAIFGLSAPVAVVASAVAIWLAVGRGDARAAASLVAALGLFLVSLPTLFLWIERIVARSVTTRRETAPRERMPLSSVIWGVCSAQCVYAAALVRAMAMRSTSWRGATYAIDGPWRIRLLHDATALPPANCTGGLHSI